MGLHLGLQLGSPPRKVSGEGTVTLNAITLTDTSYSASDEGASVIATVIGKTSGSTLNLVDSGALDVLLNGLDIEVGDFLVAGNYNLIFNEALTGATNTPRETIIPVTVSA